MSNDRRASKSISVLTGAVCLSLFASSAFAASITNTAVEVPGDLFNIDLSQNLRNRVAMALPEGSAIGREFLDPAYSPNLLISQQAQISVTAIDEGAGYRNAFGFFTFAAGTLDGLTKGDIDLNADGMVSVTELDSITGVEADWIFPNFSMLDQGGQLASGDTVTIGGSRVFEAGSTVGFFLAQDAWEGSSTDISHQTFFSLDFLNPEAQATDTINSRNAGSLSRHTAALFADDSQSEIIFGFEDLNRADPIRNVFNYVSDEDFNDAIFLVRSNPVEAIQDSNIPVFDVEGQLGTSGTLSIAAFAWWGRRRLVRASAN